MPYLLEALAWIGARLADALVGLVPELAPVLNVGAIGAVLGYLLLKTEPRLKGMEAAIDRATRGQMLFLLAFEQVNGQLRAQVQELLQEIHDSEQRRSPPGGPG